MGDHSRSTPRTPDHRRAWTSDASAILDAIEADVREATSPSEDRRYTRAFLRRRLTKSTKRLRAMLFELLDEG